MENTLTVLPVVNYKTNSRRNFRDELATKFIKSLEEDPKNWKKGWTCIHGRPINAVTGKAYNGVNTLMLSWISYEKKYEDNRWATFKQIKDNKNYLFTAIKQAETAADYMIEHGHLHELSMEVDTVVEIEEEEEEFEV